MLTSRRTFKREAAVRFLNTAVTSCFSWLCFWSLLTTWTLRDVFNQGAVEAATPACFSGAEKWPTVQ